MSLVADGGTLAPGELGDAPGTLTINGNLALGRLEARLRVRPGQCQSAVRSTISTGRRRSHARRHDRRDRVAPGGSFEPGLYRVISYGGALTDNGLDLGTMPVGRLRGADLGRGPGQSGQHRGHHAQLLGRRRPVRRTTVCPWRQRHLAARRQHEQLDRRRTAAINGAYAQDSVRDLPGAPRHRHGRQQPRRGRRLGHAVRDRRLHDHRRAADACRPAVHSSASATAPRRRGVHRDDRRRAHRRHAAGQDRSRHAGAHRHQHLHRRHRDQRRHAAGSRATPISARRRVD